MQQTAENIQSSSYMPPREVLLKRPHYNGVAIDPEHPIEIDDAIQVIALNDVDTLVRVHVADGGLIDGTAYVDQARSQGWTEYEKPGRPKLMLPIHVTEQLNLSRKAEIGVPAVTISFEFNQTSGIGATSVEKSRVTVAQFTYDSYLKLVRKGKPDAVLLQGTAHGIKRDLNLQSMSTESYMHDVVAKYMVAANTIIARFMDKESTYPWLFRNHTAEAYVQLDDTKKKQVLEEMKVALYGPNPFLHDALGLQPYCHFTSPLRRFADLANHLNLTAKLANTDPVFTEKDMATIASELTALHIARSATIRRRIAA